MLDLLTYQDLQSLHKQKGDTANAGASINDKNTAKHPDKLYLILTYAVAFDRIHYPLPLTIQQTFPDRQQQDTVRLSKLQTELDELQDERAKHLKEISRLLKENDRLKHEAKHQHEQQERERLEEQNREIIKSRAAASKSWNGGSANRRETSNEVLVAECIIVIRSIRKVLNGNPFTNSCKQIIGKHLDKLQSIFLRLSFEGEKDHPPKEDASRRQQRFADIRPTSSTSKKATTDRSRSNASNTTTRYGTRRSFNTLDTDKTKINTRRRGDSIGSRSNDSLSSRNTSSSTIKRKTTNTNPRAVAHRLSSSSLAEERRRQSSRLSTSKGQHYHAPTAASRGRGRYDPVVDGRPGSVTSSRSGSHNSVLESTRRKTR
ncbi:Coiled-coil domain-containing protein 61, partial [Quaeritorhiza haematococci]